MSPASFRYSRQPAVVKTTALHSAHDHLPADHSQVYSTGKTQSVETAASLIHVRYKIHPSLKTGEVTESNRTGDYYHVFQLLTRGIAL